MNKLIIFVIITISLLSCLNDTKRLSFGGFVSQKQPLILSTKVPSAQSYLFTEKFAKGSVLGLYITTEQMNKVSNSTCSHKNSRAEAIATEDRSIRWLHSPVIYLNSDPSTVYAYYPYQPLHSLSLKEIPVNISPDAENTYEYMYGTNAIGQKAVSNKSPFVLFYMKHALCLLLFELKLSGKTKDIYKLSAIQVGNKAGRTAIHNKGYMDITTGDIRYVDNTNGVTRLKLKVPLSLSHDKEVIHKIRITPLKYPTSREDIQVLFTINEHIYKYEIPPQTFWKRGQKYVYKLRFTGTEILQDKIITDLWGIQP